MTEKPDWTKEQIRGMRKAIATACSHLETCVQWADDSLRRWVGTLIEPDAKKLAAIGAEHPRANTLQRRLDAAALREALPAQRFDVGGEGACLVAVVAFAQHHQCIAQTGETQSDAAFVLRLLLLLRQRPCGHSPPG